MRYVFHRTILFVITLWAALTVNFALPRLMPGNPALAMMARFHGRLGGQALQAMEVAFGVHTNQSVASQYFLYLCNTFS
jgi:peptide/nickel transport system permease protein